MFKGWRAVCCNHPPPPFLPPSVTVKQAPKEVTWPDSKLWAPTAGFYFMLNALFQQHAQWVADEGSQTGSFYMCRHLLRCPAGAGGSVAHFENLLLGVCVCVFIIYVISPLLFTHLSPQGSILNLGVSVFGMFCLLFLPQHHPRWPLTLSIALFFFFFCATKACLKFASTNCKSNKRSQRQEGKLISRSRSAPDRQPLLPVMDRSRCWWEKGWGREEKTQAADFRHSTTH